MAKEKSWFESTLTENGCQCDILDKRASTLAYVQIMFDRTNKMFEYEGLPDTIPEYMLEYYLQVSGKVAITEVNGKLYALPGGLGGAYDPYYRPTLYVVANPGLGYSASLRILNHLPPFGKQDYQGECVLIRNDTSMEGLLYIFSRYATQLAENDVSIRAAQINSRQQTLVSGQSDREVAAANEYLKGIVEGRLIAVAEQPFLDGIKVNNVSTMSSNSIIQLIELQQYLKASWYNEIGLNANFNMKREYLSEEEIRTSTDVLLPLVDDMLRCREDALAVVNSTYGTNITVKKSSSWDNKQVELDTAQDQADADVEKTKAEADKEDDDESDSE